MDSVAQKVVDLYEENQERAYSDKPAKDDGVSRGYEDLSSAVGFIEHALQAAKQAEDAQVDEETVIAALLHDIGWLAPKPKDDAMLTSGDEAVFLAKHDVVGSAMLRQYGFSDRLARLVEGHVQAKRYLTHKVDGYYDALSEGSKFTLSHQGGPMTAQEAAAFEAEPDFDLFCQIRRWDEGAKVKDMALPKFATYKDAMVRMLRKALWTERQALSIDKLVTASLKTQMDEQGYVVIRNWLTDAEIAVLPSYADHVATLPQGASHPGPFHTYEMASKGRVLSRSECFADADDEFAVGAFLKFGRLRKICEALRNNRRQVLLKEKINYKLAGAGGYLPHQDGYWQMARVGDGAPMAKAGKPAPQKSELVRTELMKDDQVCVCMVAVDASTASNGCPSIAPGWHNKGWLGLNASSDPVDIETKVDADDLPWKQQELAPGDVLIYGNLMPHMSAANTSDHDRRALFAIYADAESLGDDIRERYYEYEMLHRRAKGTAVFGGKANRYFTGEAVVVDPAK